MSSDIQKEASSPSTDSSDDSSSSLPTTLPSQVSQPSSSSLQLPDISKLRIDTSAEGKRPMLSLGPNRSVSDSGPPRPSSSRVATSGSSGSDSPLGPIQAARGQLQLGARPPSSSGSVSSVPGVSKLPAGMQAKMMAVPPSENQHANIVPCKSL